jgi:ATP-dependent RNA helicase MRH4
VAELQDQDIQAYRERMANERALAAGGRGGRRRLMMDEPNPTMARPKVVILVPTAELVDQVGHVAKLISHRVKFRSERISANVAPMVIHRNVYSPAGLDLLVATPHLLSSIAQSDPNILSRVSHLVIDEADSLFDRNFADDTTSIVDRTMPSLKQLILCTATVPRRLDNFIALKFPHAVRITTPNLHAIPRRVQLGVIDVVKEPYRGNRDLACADAIYTIGKEAARPLNGEIEVRRILVFVNERETTQRVADYLVSKGIDAIAFHRDTSELRLTEMLGSFTTPAPLRIPEPESTRDKRRSLPNVKVIVGTDLISRGIDTLAVRHVILYDVPHTAIDFIHRLGRAGRMNRRGRGIVLVGNRDRRDIVAEVKESMFMGQALI